MAHEQDSLSRELELWKRKYDKLKDKYKKVLQECGREDVDEEMRSLGLSDEEHSFDIVGTKLESLTESQQPESSVNQPTSAYLAAQDSRKRSVICGQHSFTIVPKDCKPDSLRPVSECSEGKLDAGCLKEENERLREKIRDLEIQLSLVEASIDKPMSAQSDAGLVGAGGAVAVQDVKSPTADDTPPSEKERDLTETIHGLREEMATIKEEMGRTKEEVECLQRDKEEMMSALDRSAEEQRGLREEVEEYKKKAADEMAKAKDWEMQLDETTCRLIAKQDEIDALQQTGRP